jgi:hypothetical protein
MQIKTSAGMKVKTAVKAGLVAGQNPLCLVPPCRPAIMPIGCTTCM